jgi:TolA-binding protein
MNKLTFLIFIVIFSLCNTQRAWAYLNLGVASETDSVISKIPSIQSVKNEEASVVIPVVIPTVNSEKQTTISSETQNQLDKLQAEINLLIQEINQLQRELIIKLQK